MSILSRGKGPHAGHEGQAIAVENIVKKYGDFEAVKGVTFDVKDGEIFGLLGPNGAGKSTLIRMMTTLIPITSGKAFIAGYDVSENADAARRTMGVIPQAMTSDIDLTIAENMSIYAKLYGVPRTERERNITELLEAVDLTKWRDAQVKTLSGGMRRRAEIARGLVHNPRIFFLDEPTTGLDPVSRVAVWEMLNTLKSRRQLTILITTHYMDEAERLCQRVAIMDHGKAIALGTPRELIASIGVEHMVEFSTARPAEAVDHAALRRLEGVRDVRSQDGAVQLQVAELHRAVPALLDELERQGVPLTELRTHSATLEDVFVALTGRRLRDE
jgi:ABC-2 type transport system ATP-binding protein